MRGESRARAYWGNMWFRANEIDSALGLWLFCRISPDTPILLSYPKSGRTWLKFILAKYFILESGADFDLNLRTLNSLIPNLSFRRSFFGKNGGFDGQMYSSHSLTAYITRLKRPMFLVRDPRDLLTSYFFHQTSRSVYYGNLKHFIFKSRFGANNLISYMNGFCCVWEGNPDGFLLIRYEDLKENTNSQVLRVLRYLNWEINGDHLREAIDFASVDNMMAIELKKGNMDDDPETVRSVKSDFRFVRRGKVGGYKDYLDRSDQERLNMLLKNRLRDHYGYQFD